MSPGRQCGSSHSRRKEGSHAQTARWTGEPGRRCYGCPAAAGSYLLRAVVRFHSRRRTVSPRVDRDRWNRRLLRQWCRRSTGSTGDGATPARHSRCLVRRGDAATGAAVLVAGLSTQSAHRTLCRACRMGSDHHATPLFSRTNDQLRTIVEQTGGAAFRMGRRLDRGGGGDGPAPQVDQGADSLCRASHRRTLPDPPRAPHCHTAHPGG